VLRIFGFKEALEYQFIYTFKNLDEATVENKNKIFKVLQSRLT